MHTVAKFSIVSCIFSNGILKIRCISSRHDIAWADNVYLIEMNLLAQKPLPQCLGNKGLDDVKLTDAKQASLVQDHDRVILGLCYQIQDNLELRKVWRFEELVFRLVPSQTSGSKAFSLAPDEGEGNLQVTQSEEIEAT